MPLLSALTFGVAVGVGLVLTPFVRRLARRLGRVAEPREDRWHKQPTPILGGVGIAAAFAAGMAVSGARLPWGLLAGSALAFMLGLIDDFRRISPQAKLLGQFLAAAVVVFFGYTTAFFPWPLANMVLSFAWLVAITNALNLLDNMDGLAAGMALIAAGFMAFFFWRAGNETFMALSLALAGSALSFLVFNFPPASIFMGDSGSLFLGFTLAALAIAREPQASNVFAVLTVPSLIFLLPILDTAVVTITRLLRGQSPAHGGRDHTSHRLVALGLKERQAVLVLLGVALISGLAAVTIESFSYGLSLVLVPIVVLALSLVAAYLGRVRLVPVSEAPPPGLFPRLMIELTYRRRLLEVVFDFFLIGLTYFLAFAARFGLPLDSFNTQLYLQSLPIVVIATYLSFFAFGVYRGVWRYVGVEDLMRFAEAVAIGTAVGAIALLMLYRFEGYSRAVFVLHPLFLFLALAGSRLCFRVLDQVVSQRPAGHKQAVLIYGAGDAGELALRECQRNPALAYQVVGFLDDDPLKWGRSIHGVEVLGGVQHLEALLAKKQVDGMLVASAAILATGSSEKAAKICRERNVWIRRMRLEFELQE